MNVKITGNGSVAVGEYYEDGQFVIQYEVFANECETEQKVLAWVYHFCMKNGVDAYVIKEFIECCTSIHPELNIFEKAS